MPKPKAFVTRKIAQEALDIVASSTEMELWKDEPPPRNVLLDKVQTIEGLLSLITDKVDAELMGAGPKLKVD